MTVQELYNMAVTAHVQDEPLLLRTIEDGKLKTYTFSDLVEVKQATALEPGVLEPGFMCLSAEDEVNS